MATQRPSCIGVLTSGGDAQGMNAALRSVVRTALDRDVEVYAIYEGYQGMVDGGDRIRKMTWDSVGGILYQGGTIIGTARCPAFQAREGRLQAAGNLLHHGIDRLIVIGGDGSLTGANIFREEWVGLVAELVETRRVEAEVAQRHPQLRIVGLVGSIDNDMYGTDMTIGTDSALHRITEAIDAINSTAASHQRSFVVEVMGRNCGYLALMSAIATGADWVLIPENPPEDHWEEKMCQLLQAGREAGRRDSIVVVAEGMRDRRGNPIKSEYIKNVLEERLGEETRVTVLGHVQRGGAPSAFDRNMSTILGYEAVQTILSENADNDSYLMGMRNNRITRLPLMHCVEQTRAVAEAIARQDYERAVKLRGTSFREAIQTMERLEQALPRPPQPGQKQLRLAVMNAGGPAPGMNTATRAAVRQGIDQGHVMLGIHDGFLGLINDSIMELGWMSVAGWASMGGSELGTNRKVPEGRDLYAIARTLEKHGIQGLLVIGGLAGYQASHRLSMERDNFPAFNIPIICMPATINNNLPGSELSIGADTALNNIVQAVDKIKQSAVASRRCFVVEVMGRHCGYLALMSGLATGAERVYIHEEGMKLADLQLDLNHLVRGFKGGKRLGLMIRSEGVHDVYNTSFMCALFEEEGGDLFDVRQAILGHLQQGGDPSPFDRSLATRLALKCVNFLIEESDNEVPRGAFIGLTGGKVQFFDLYDLPRMMDPRYGRPREQWWMELRNIARVLAQPGPHAWLEE
ncbi:MAG: 6-phosphofructokinase [Chloroflexaceae bacterium]|nr:6-phosphofructokinase [Chloroflexaceae bacterium]